MYPKQAQKIAMEWRASLFTEDDWDIDTAHKSAPGEAGGYWVNSAVNNSRAWLKPTKRCPDSEPRAGNEKIAFDLAFELGFPVPPVQLYRLKDSMNQGGIQESRTCLSLVCFQEVWTWKQISERFSGYSGELQTQIINDLKKAMETLSFDMYLGNRDRSGNTGNIIYGINSKSKESGFLFIDYAFSMNSALEWSKSDGNFSKITLPPNNFGIELDSDEVKKGAQRISDLPDDVIAEVVGRLSDDYMDADHKETVSNGLSSRKLLLLEEVRKHYGD